MTSNTSRSLKKMGEYERDCCVRGYHVYQEIWEAAVGECSHVKDNRRMLQTDTQSQ